MKHTWFSVLLAVGLLLLVTTPLVAEDHPQLVVPDEALAELFGIKSETATYVVQLIDDPVVTYEGGIRGLPATAPKDGEKINPNSGTVRKYVKYLHGRHGEVLSATGSIDRLYDYVYSFNGVAAVLTPTQAIAMAKHPDVVVLWADAARQIETYNTPSFLGLDAGGGVWDQLGGAGDAGEDMIIGVLDTGIWPEHPAFSDQSDFAHRPGNSGKRTRVYGPPPNDWHGECVSGEQFSQDACNNKLIGARFYRLGAAASTVIPTEYLSPRDRDGHGTHTASTAGGNHGVTASIFGIDRGLVSGMAPRARIAAYKVCWNNVGCFFSDILQAIDDAVADGVDVINYSIGGGPSLLGPDDIAFLFAANGGVFVATSAGNSGPGSGTVGGPASVPWITAVGASTHDKTFEGSVILGDSSEIFGASVTGDTNVLPIVDSAIAGSELCIPGELDSSTVAGKIVLCLRGAIARVDKSRAVFEAGGAGLVLYNQSDAQALLTDNHFVPSVHINNTDGLAVKAYIAAEGSDAVAHITEGVSVSQAAPWMADFSSRGPDVVAMDIIKPDVTAPGVNVLAGNSPNPFLGAPGQLFQSISGTSMSSPHVAGVAALLRQLHPNWTPEMVKSALMTSAGQGVMKQDGVTPADPFDMGAGHIAPSSAWDPGLVYDAGFLDYLGFLCDAAPEAFLDPEGTCAFLDGIGIPTDASDLNLASIGIAELAGFQTIERTVTSVTPGTSTYNVSVSAPPGIHVLVSPASLTLDEGDSASYEVTFTTLGSATLDEWTFGSLTWMHGPHNVRSPIAVKPVALAAPDEIFGSGTPGSVTYDVTFGYDGDFAAEPHGLIPAEAAPDNVVDDPENDINAALGTCDFSSFPFACTGITWHLANAPAGTEYVRISLFDNYTDGNDDLDLYVWAAPDLDDFGTYVFAGASGSPTSTEEVNIVGPAATQYAVAVHGWQTDGPDANYTLFNWALGATAETNMTVTAPSSATLGDTAAITVDWTGLATPVKYLGSVTYHDVAPPADYSDGLIDFTIVRIDTD